MNLSRRVWLVVLLGLGIAEARPVLATQDPAVPDVVRQEEESRVAVIASASRSTVCIFDRKGEGGGSGVLVTADGFAVTNFHVVQPCGPFLKCGLNDGRLYDAVLVGVDPTGDVALIKLLGREDFVPAQIGDSDQLRVGEACFAAGNPFLLAHDYRPTITWGTVSGVHRYQYPEGGILEYADCIQTDAAINPGNSGGPLFNARGELVGINGRGSFEKRGRVNVGVGYAISINQVQRFYSLLKGGRIADHATLGATFASSAEGEVRVSNLSETSDAFRQGLQFDDRLVAFAGHEIRSVNQYKNLLGTFPRDWRVALTVEREGKPLTFQVRLAGNNDPSKLDELVNGPVTPTQPTPEKGDAPALPPELATQPSNWPVPPELQASYEARRGFANFHFNRLEQKRVLQALRQSVPPQSLSGKWILTGTVGADTAQWVLGDQQFGLKRGARAEVWDGQASSLEQLTSEEGRWLIPLALCRRLLVSGAERLGALEYAGQFDLPDTGLRYDVLLEMVGSLEVHYFVELPNHRLAMIEVRGLSDHPVIQCWFRGAGAASSFPLADHLQFHDGPSGVQTISDLRFQLSASAGTGDLP